MSRFHVGMLVRIRWSLTWPCLNGQTGRIVARIPDELKRHLPPGHTGEWEVAPRRLGRIGLARRARLLLSIQRTVGAGRAGRHAGRHMGRLRVAARRHSRVGGGLRDAARDSAAWERPIADPWRAGIGDPEEATKGAEDGSPSRQYPLYAPNDALHALRKRAVSRANSRCRRTRALEAVTR